MPSPHPSVARHVRRHAPSARALRASCLLLLRPASKSPASAVAARSSPMSNTSPFPQKRLLLLPFPPETLRAPQSRHCCKSALLLRGASSHLPQSSPSTIEASRAPHLLFHAKPPPISSSPRRLAVDSSHHASSSTSHYMVSFSLLCGCSCSLYFPRNRTHLAGTRALPPAMAAPRGR